MFSTNAYTQNANLKIKVNDPVPLLPNKTLDGKTIDENYYKGHITLVSFMFIGCVPCMNEIGVLNKIKKEYTANKQFQMLCVARQMKQQMVQFNATDSSIFSRIRRAMNVDSIQYSIQPACNDEASKILTEGNHITVKSECTTLEEKYGITSFPTIFYVDKKGIVRKIKQGGPPAQNDTFFYKEVKRDIDSLLSE